MSRGRCFQYRIPVTDRVSPKIVSPPNYIASSVQKRGSGRVVTQLMSGPHEGKEDLAVVWLDLVNVHESIQHSSFFVLLFLLGMRHYYLSNYNFSRLFHCFFSQILIHPFSNVDMEQHK